MGILSKFVKLTTVGSVAGVGVYLGMTRKIEEVPLSTSDYLFNSVHFRTFNPLQNPTTHDLFVRKVPLSEIDPALLENKGKLVERFCAGVWGGLGYAFQRAYLARKYQGPQTANQLWSRQELKNATYEPGTQITDHFEVIEKTPERIVVRCGDSPLKRDVRESDGLFEMSAVVKPEEGVAEFGLKSVFYQGLGKAESEPMPPHIAWLHKVYTKVLLETAIHLTTR
ncbi:hypothetical protein DTO271G3_2795 [Paecilomyces variotii]|nr:hypothetical protein DTO271G3_2795 [Paecilomyces variotii]